MNVENILKYLASITNVFKPNEALLKARAEKREIKNSIRREKAQNKILKLTKKEIKLQRRLRREKEK